MTILGLCQRVVGLKAKNPKLKVLLAIGGWSFGTAKFKKMAETRFSRQTFIFSGIKMSKNHSNSHKITGIYEFIELQQDKTIVFFSLCSNPLLEKV